ncbi:MAG TPA: MSMEG_0567/Sll0786 family nitrogen starvation N-acetyltransferase [Polyangiales bacterium]|nr:MSMEG_0567/Sll0786 family nitrogen starvation N-acetyltransferase [Polyangiales bacterium]
MLELTRPYGAPVRSFVSAYVTHAVASEAWQVAAYWQLRSQVFCEELRIFAGPAEERDEQDAHAVPIIALAHSAGSPESVVGVVRIYAAGGGVWFGGRLGVAAAYRTQRHVGSGLISTAVRSAAALGCERFLAHVLAANVPYFMRHRFRPLRDVEMHGQKHVLMEAQLPTRVGPTFAQSALST